MGKPAAERVQIGFRVPIEAHEWLKRVCFHEGRKIQDWLVEAVEEKLDRAGAGQPEQDINPAARLFGQEMAEFYGAVEGGPDELFVGQIRSLADVVIRTRKHQQP